MVKEVKKDVFSTLANLVAANVEEKPRGRVPGSFEWGELITLAANVAARVCTHRTRTNREAMLYPFRDRMMSHFDTLPALGEATWEDHERFIKSLFRMAIEELEGH